MNGIIRRVRAIDILSHAHGKGREDRPPFQGSNTQKLLCLIALRKTGENASSTVDKISHSTVIRYKIYQYHRGSAILEASASDCS